MNEPINTEKIAKHWIETSDKDFNTMLHLFEAGDFHWALFMGHIVLEKLLKACVVNNTQSHPPFTHDLVRLAKLSGIDFTEGHADWLDTITTFNLNAMYDSYKQAFYKKCTIAFTSEWIENIKMLMIWIKEKS